MNPADEVEYRDLVETAARAIAFGGGKPSRRAAASQLISRAVELAGGWNGFDADTPPGADLPIVDAAVDEVFDRANELRRQFFGLRDDAATRTRH